MNAIRRCVITTAYALAWLAFGTLLALRPFDTPHHDPPVALCPNYDSIYVHSAHWDQTKRPAGPVRVIPAPPCEDTTAVAWGDLRD